MEKYSSHPVSEQKSNMQVFPWMISEWFLLANWSYLIQRFNLGNIKKYHCIIKILKYSILQILLKFEVIWINMTEFLIFYIYGAAFCNEVVS